MFLGKFLDYSIAHFSCIGNYEQAFYFNRNRVIYYFLFHYFIVYLLDSKGTYMTHNEFERLSELFKIFGTPIKLQIPHSLTNKKLDWKGDLLFVVGFSSIGGYCARFGILGLKQGNLYTLTLLLAYFLFIYNIYTLKLKHFYTAILLIKAM